MMTFAILGAFVGVVIVVEVLRHLDDRERKRREKRQWEEM